MQLIYRGRRSDLIAFLTRLPMMLAGKSPDTTRGGVRAILIRVGMVALSIIRDAFEVKAQGGTDDAGLKWRPLKPESIAYGRRHHGLVRDTHWRYRPSQMLSGAERTHWWALYKQRKGWYKGDKAHAAASAWVALKQTGARTILSVYGSKVVEILKDTGRLFASLSPGLKNKDQIFKIEPGQVTVGTSVEYAAAQHKTRPLWADWKDWPDHWKEQIYDAIKDGIADMIVRWMTSGGRKP